MLPVQGLGAGGGQTERKSFEHPPGKLLWNYDVEGDNLTAIGYHQNIYQGSTTGGQFSGTQQGQSVQSGQWHRAGAIDDSTGEESIWETAKKWAYSAGEKMAETEAEIWKRVNGEK
jgi:hypothetical protein